MGSGAHGLVSIDDILGLSEAAGASGRPSGEFERLAMQVFRRQAVVCAPYRDYLDAIEVDPLEVGGIAEVPFLPIELFKTQRVYCGPGEPETTFTSSATGGEGPSRHHMASVRDYERNYTRGFELFYGDPRSWSIFALLPSYLERRGSSLVRMAEGLIERGQEAGRGGGFYLYDHQRLLDDMAATEGPKILLGVSYALLDLAEEVAATGAKLPPETIVMETGGMKGRRREISKAQMHNILQQAFNVERIDSEYGMAELMSQAWSDGGGVFRTPGWMRVAVRDLTDPFDVKFAENAGGSGKGNALRGGLNIIDLGNLHSCAFIQTQDVATLFADGAFTIDGRVAHSDVRGCNLMVND